MGLKPCTDKLAAESACLDPLVQIQIVDGARVRLRTTSVRKVLREVDAAIEVQATIVIDIDVQRAVIRGRVDQPDLARLEEVISDDEMLLVGGEFQEMGADGVLDLLGVVETDGVVEVGDVEGGDVVAGGVGEVGEAGVVRDVGEDGGGVAGVVAEVVEEFGNALGAVGVFAEGVDDPDLAEVDGRGEESGLGVAGNEFIVLNAATLGRRLATRMSKWWRIAALTFGMVTVLRIVRESRSHRVTVSPRTMPSVVSNDNTTLERLQRLMTDRSLSLASRWKWGQQSQK